MVGNMDILQTEIVENTGIPFAELIDMDWEEIDRRIERKIGKELKFSSEQDDRLPIRGSVFLMLGRLIFGKDIQTRFDAIRPLVGRG